MAHNAFGALASVDTGHIGGIEWQTSMMARWFAARGYPVSMITWDEGQEDGVEIDGVRVLKMCRKDAGIKGLRFFWPKWTSLVAAMQRANADIYYYNCGDLGLGQVVMWCRRHARKSVYSVASDPDCDPELPVLKKLRERVLYKYGLHHVDSVVVQTRRQQQMLREGFGIDSTMISMPCEVPCKNGDVGRETTQEESMHVLWVGRISKEKRFEWLLDVAEQCSQIIFDVVGASNSDSEYARVLTKRAAGITNVRMHGRVPYGEMASYYQRCRVLCCTSAYEGFPNTFLEAWSHGLPIVSSFDPDNLIDECDLGVVAKDVLGLANGIKSLLNSQQHWRKASSAAKQYYLANHTPDACLPRFEHLFLQVAGYQP